MVVNRAEYLSNANKAQVGLYLSNANKAYVGLCILKWESKGKRKLG